MAAQDSPRPSEGQRPVFHVKHHQLPLDRRLRKAWPAIGWGSAMKLMSFRRPDRMASWGIAKNGGVIDLGDRAPGLRHALWAKAALAEESKRDVDFRFEDITFLPAIPDPSKI